MCADDVVVDRPSAIVAKGAGCNVYAVCVGHVVGRDVAGLLVVFAGHDSLDSGNSLALVGVLVSLCVIRAVVVGKK